MPVLRDLGSASASAPPRRTASRVDVQFPQLSYDADTDLPSWRTGLHSDWQLRVGDALYKIHKVLTGHGPRASAFLCSAFTTGSKLLAGDSGAGPITPITAAPEEIEARSGEFDDRDDSEGDNAEVLLSEEEVATVDLPAERDISAPEDQAASSEKREVADAAASHSFGLQNRAPNRPLGRKLKQPTAACRLTLLPAAGPRITDLTQILPEDVWPHFGEVLDFIYGEDVSITEKSAVPLLCCADILQIRSLFTLCVDRINDGLMSVAFAPRILADSAVLLGGSLAEQIQGAAEDVIAENFDVYATGELAGIPTDHLVQILKRDDLNIMHENDVFDRIRGLAAQLGAIGRQAEAVKLWQCLRLGSLSNCYLARASRLEFLPPMALVWSKILHRKSGGKIMQQRWPSSRDLDAGCEGFLQGPQRPRKLFRDLVCAVMYSVDTEARNDQDVERNITAATLVAEEIGYLGGRAILENMFFRPPSTRSPTAVEQEINMDQVDVAFVLAPWTPWDKKITRLINFVDNGGGAVLLSFIGGLSKGPWLDGEYEPLITGKAPENTPYEDVCLAPSIASILEEEDGRSVKRYQDTESPPRLLCGVDCINGRRRITSRLVPGAKVLAKWSDGQPLVVQHPKKNVFSVSQRVSRIFELEEELGHDDTLQLVLNVMLQAGKEARRNRDVTSIAEGRADVKLDATGGVNVSL